MTRTIEVADLTPGDWKYEPEMEDDDLELNPAERPAGFIYVETGPEDATVLVNADWATDADLAVMAASKKLLAAAQVVLAGLNARIDAADRSSVPVFDGIADLHAAIAAATTTEG